MSIDRYNNDFESGILRDIGVDVVSLDPLVGRFDVTEGVIAPNGYVFAAVIIALADGLAAIGTIESRPERAVGHTTIELKTNFLGTARVGETVEGRAIASHLGRTTQVWDVAVDNTTTGKPMALFRCTQMLLYPRD